MLIKTNRNKIPFLVASAGAPAKVKAVASYVCEGRGADDEKVIQRALDDCLEYIGSGLYQARGRVQLSLGDFWLHPSTAAEGQRLVGSGATLSNYSGSYSVLDVGSVELHDQILVGDIIVIRDGSYSAFTLQTANQDGPRRIVAVTGSGMTSTQVMIACHTYYTFTSVNWYRPAWSIKVPSGVDLCGEGIIKTVLTWDPDAVSPPPASVLFLAARESYTGYQTLQNLSVHGSNLGTQTNWWECNGILTGAAFDAYFDNVSSRYHQGYGLVVGQGWGFAWKNGWIEDCRHAIFSNGQPFFMKLKAQQSTDHNIIIEADVNTEGPTFSHCEVQSNGTSGHAAILARPMTYGFRYGGVVRTIGADDRGIMYVRKADVADSGRAGRIDVNWVAAVSGSKLISTVSTWISHLKLSGTAYPYPGQTPGAVIDQFGNFFHSGSIEITGSVYDSTSRVRTSSVVNSSGVAFSQGYAYCWKSGTLNQVQLPANDDDATFAGVATRYPVSNGSTGRLVVDGGCMAYANAAEGAIAANDLLSLSRTVPGAFKKAIIGERAYARALEAKASGAGVIAAELIRPRDVGRRDRVMFTLPGNLEVGDNQTNPVLMIRSGKILSARALAGTPPVGAAAIFGLNLTGTPIQTDPNRLRIADGEASGTSSSFSVDSFSDGDYFTLDVDQIGSGTPGADVTVVLQVAYYGV